MNIQKNSTFETGFNKLNMEILDSGYAVTDRSWLGVDVCSPFTRLYFIDGGEGLLRFGEENMLLKPGYAYLIPTGLVFQYSCEHSVGQLFFHINLLMPNGYDLLRRASRCEQLVFPVEETEALKRLYAGEDISQALELKGRLYETVSRFIRKLGIDSEDVSRYSPVTRRAIEYIRSHLSVQLGVSDIAKCIFVSESTLVKLFRKEVGVPLGAYIDDLVFFRAEVLVSETQMSLRDISSSLGFCDQFYFSRRFSQRHGESPRTYRRRVQTTRIL